MKSILSSKTVYFNLIVTIVTLAGALQGNPTLILWAPYLVIASIVGNTILRVWFTSQPVTQFSASQTSQSQSQPQ